MSNYFFKVSNGIVTDSAAAGEFTGTGWIYSGSNLIFPGMYYNAQLKKCYWPCMYPSWTLDPVTFYWVPPQPKPNDGANYMWNEDAQTWDLMANVTVNLPYELYMPTFDIP